MKDGKREDVSREPEQVKAFRDTWKDGIHSYLTYLRDRLTVARELLTESGSIFVQIGDENVHRVRAVMDEVFGAENFVAQVIAFKKRQAQTRTVLLERTIILLWYAAEIATKIKFRQLCSHTETGGDDLANMSTIRFADLQGITCRVTIHRALTSSAIT